MTPRRRVVRRHNCPRPHTTFLGFAMCVWPEARWVLGDGPYATVRSCGGDTTVLLHATEQTAAVVMQSMHPGGPNGRCTMQHELAVLVLPGEDGAL